MLTLGVRGSWSENFALTSVKSQAVSLAEDQWLDPIALAQELKDPGRKESQKR
jgi:hypothetical protein